MRLSCEAIEFQSGGNIHSDPTIQTYWDAGRLDLVRVGIRTGAKLMSALAGMMIDDAERVRVFRIETFGIVPADALGFLTCLSPLKLSHYGGANGRGWRWLGSDIRMRIA
jgi:hypothetical protein